MAGYHYDLNFLTIHGKSNFPGLNIWYCHYRHAPQPSPALSCIHLRSRQGGGPEGRSARDGFAMFGRAGPSWHTPGALARAGPLGD